MELKPHDEKQMKAELSKAIKVQKMFKLLKKEKKKKIDMITQIKQRIAMAEMNGDQEEYDRLNRYLITHG